MSKRSAFRIEKNLVRRWKREVAAATVPIYVFSPYITSDTAEVVLSATTSPADCHVHTVFESKLFVNGASSIFTLRRLFDRGVRLYAVKDLHAKIVAIPYQFASIGSQNLTAGGKKRLEASVASNDVCEVQRVWDLVEPWRRLGTPIDREMIAEMVKALGPLRRAEKSRLIEFESLDAKLQAKRKARQEEQERQEKLEKERKEQFLHAHMVRQNAREVWERRTRKAKQSVQAKLVSKPGKRGTTRYTLQGWYDADLTNWKLNDGYAIRFERLSWYVCLMEESLKLAFVRLARTCISYVSRGVIWNYSQRIADEECKISCEANWQSDVDRGNLSWEIEPTCLPLISLTTWFHIDGLKLLDPQKENDSAAWVAENKDKIERDLFGKLVEFNRFTKPLTDTLGAEKFFTPGCKYNLRAGLIENQRILMAHAL